MAAYILKSLLLYLLLNHHVNIPVHYLPKDVFFTIKVSVQQECLTISKSEVLAEPLARVLWNSIIHFHLEAKLNKSTVFHSADMYSIRLIDRNLVVEKHPKSSSRSSHSHSSPAEGLFLLCTQRQVFV